MDEQDKKDAPAATDMDAIKDFVVKAVNGAITTRMERERKALDDKLTGMFSGITEQLTALQNTPKPDAPADSPTKNDELKNVEAKYKKQMDEMKAMLEKEVAQREVALKQKMVEEERNALREALSAKGVPAPMAKAAVAMLHGEMKVLERNDNGEIEFLFKEQAATGAYTDRVSVQEGVERFLKTEEGKFFLPPKPAGGAGGQGGGAPTKQAAAPGDIDIAALFQGLGSTSI